VATPNEAAQAILASIVSAADTANAAMLRDLAEALAWIQSPAQPHGK
jgi:hypothetical protein